MELVRNTTFFLPDGMDPYVYIIVFVLMVRGNARVMPKSQAFRDTVCRYIAINLFRLLSFAGAAWNSSIELDCARISRGRQRTSEAATLCAVNIEMIPMHFISRSCKRYLFNQRPQRVRPADGATLFVPGRLLLRPLCSDVAVFLHGLPPRLTAVSRLDHPFLRGSDCYRFRCCHCHGMRHCRQCDGPYPEAHGHG